MIQTTPTYWDYLDLPKRLNAQSGLGDGDIGPDELHFINVHQAYELCLSWCSPKCGWQGTTWSCPRCPKRRSQMWSTTSTV